MRLAFDASVLPFTVRLVFSLSVQLSDATSLSSASYHLM